MLQTDWEKKGEFNQIPISSSEFSDVIINKTSVLSATKSRAFESEGFDFRLNLVLIFLILSGEPESMRFILIFFFAACSNAGSKTLDLSSKSKTDVQIRTSFFAF